MNATERPMHLPKTSESIRREFPGKSNAGLRKQLRDSALSGWIDNCSSVGLTTWGEISLSEVRRVFREEMIEQGLAGPDGYPLYAIGPDEHGTPTVYLDQPTKQYVP